MKHKSIGIVFVALFFCSAAFAADDPASEAVQAPSPSFGTQAGEAARELQGKAAEGISTGATKVAETSQNVETQIQEAFKTLQQQWDEFVKQLQEKTRHIQKTLDQQWKDFNQSFHNPAS